MVKSLTIWIPGKPATVTAQQKVITKGGKIFDCQRLMVARADLFCILAEQAPSRPLDGNLSVEVTWAWTRKGQTQPEWKNTKPDLDNLAKLLLDEMGRAGIITDDARVVELVLRKLWVQERDEGIKIVVREILHLTSGSECV